jgi:hypothetical protein
VTRAIRGRRPQDADDLLIHREIGEQLLHDEGVTRQDIHGVDRTVAIAQTRHDATATVRRVLSAFGRRQVQSASAVAAVACAVVTAFTGTVTVGILAVVCAGVATGANRAPDSVFTDPPDTHKVGKIRSDGMTGDEFRRRLAIVQERKKYEQEQREKERKRQRRRANQQNNRP